MGQVPASNQLENRIGDQRSYSPQSNTNIIVTSGSLCFAMSDFCNRKTEVSLKTYLCLVPMNCLLRLVFVDWMVLEMLHPLVHHPSLRMSMYLLYRALKYLLVFVLSILDLRTRLNIVAAMVRPSDLALYLKIIKKKLNPSLETTNKVYTNQSDIVCFPFQDP